MLVTVFFGVIAGDKLLELRDQQTTLHLQDVALAVKNEIDVAHAMESGYIRTFVLPEYIGRDNYSVTMENNFVVVLIKEREFLLAVQPVNGTVQKGTNIIVKNGSRVVLNG